MPYKTKIISSKYKEEVENQASEFAENNLVSFSQSHVTAINSEILYTIFILYTDKKEVK